MKLLALVLLLSAFSSLTLTEVVKDFNTHCPEFFYPKDQNERIIPTIFEVPECKMICQHLKNKYRFATLYDTLRRIPVYSAYTFSRQVKTNRSNVWNIEPQLEDIKEYKEQKNMIVSPNDTETVRKITHQALYSDYTDSGYTRGHMFPYLFAADQDQANSTFTLTNMVPQKKRSNEEWGRIVEQPMLTAIRRDCKLDQNDSNKWAYMLTGAVPGDKWLPITRDKKYSEGINIPSHLWSVFVCTSIRVNGKVISKAYVAEQENFVIEQMTVEQLNEKLTKLYKDVYNKHVDFRVFPSLNL